jgi:alginate O-acetyltransferase complex protein AlgI
MLFQTVEFLVLILIVISAIFLLRNRHHQQLVLLATNYIFYGWWDVRFVILLLMSTVMDFAAALGIEGVKLKWPDRIKLCLILLVGTWVCLGLNWPALQHGTKSIGWREFLKPGWDQAPLAIGVCVAFTLAGLVFYGWFFTFGEQARRRAFLITSLCGNLGILGFFKYFNFFRDNFTGLGNLLGYDWSPDVQSALSIALPVGISFYTFQTMAYTIDVYQGMRAERSFLPMAVFVGYFPHLVAGPIIRPQVVLSRLEKAWTMRAKNIYSGFNLALVGLFKKVLIADSVSPLTDSILSEPVGQPSVLIVLGTILFAVQIYCDFSGYTDIARGVSRMIGVEIPLNFNFPYFSTSIIEFWRRWHISLSTWLRDYLYIPLGGGKVHISRVYFNLMITMVLGGLWHGAAWNFVIWGFYQGLLLCLNRAFAEAISRSAKLSALFRAPLMRVVCWAVTMYFVLIGWLIFRVQSLDAVWYSVKAFVVWDGRMSIGSRGLGNAMPGLAMAALVVFVVLHTISYFVRPWPDLLDRIPRPLLLAAYALLAIVFFFGWPSHNAPFIYFQF